MTTTESLTLEQQRKLLGIAMQLAALVGLYKIDALRAQEDREVKDQTTKVITELITLRKSLPKDHPIWAKK